MKKEELSLDMAFGLMLGKIPLERKDPYFLIAAINTVRRRKRELIEVMELYSTVSFDWTEDRDILNKKIDECDDAIYNYKPLFV